MSRPKGEGLKRTIAFLVMLNEDEFEYLHRLERYNKEQGKPQKKVQRIRERVFVAGWQRRLAELRKSQGGNIKP